MKDLKMNKEVEISYQEAKDMIVDPHQRYVFNSLNESTIDEYTPFEMVQNRRYYVRKIGRRGSVVNMGYGREKAKNGVAEVSMVWDFRHPKNFALNENNLAKTFIVIL